MTTPYSPWPDDVRYLQTGDLRVDLCYRRVQCAGTELELPQRVFDLLLLFLAEPHKLHTRADLFQRLWPGLIVEDANLSQSVWLLRKSLGEERKHWVRTVAKGGYVFEPPSPVEAVHEERTRSTPHSDAEAELPASTAGTEATADTDVSHEATLPRPREVSGAGARHWTRRWALVAIAATAAVAIVSGIWLYEGKKKPQPVSTPAPALTVALVIVEDRTTHAQWPARLLYDWLRWKLSSLPEVTVLTEAELAAGAGRTPPQVVFIASGEVSESPGKLVLRSRLQQGQNESRIELDGTEEQMPAQVDLLSNQIMETLIPSRARPWPKLEVDAPAAKRYREQAEAIDRRDWITATRIGSEVVGMAPRFGLARLQLAQAKSQLSQAPDALEQMNIAIELLQPLSAEAREQLEAKRLDMDPQRFLEATAAYGRLAKRYPDNLAYTIAYAGALSSTGKPQDALAALDAHDYSQAPIGSRIGALMTRTGIYESLGDPARMLEYAKETERLAASAGPGWEQERAKALIYIGSFAQENPNTPSPLYEQAAKLFEQAGNPTGALLARFIAETSTPPSGGPNPRLDKLLAQANAGGYRELEFGILLRLAGQLHSVGDLDGYRRRMEQAAGVAQISGDIDGRNRIELLLLNEDLLTLRLGSADKRAQYIREAGLQGSLASTGDLLEASVNEVRGNYRYMLKAMDQAARRVPEVPGQPLSEAQAEIACYRAWALVALGDLTAARASAKRCGGGTSPDTQQLLMITHAGIELLAGDRVTAREELQRAIAALAASGEAGPDYWLTAMNIARLQTRLGQHSESDRLLQPIVSKAHDGGYTLIAALAETGLAENAAARGDWNASRRHSTQARQMVPADAWIVIGRLDLLEAAAAVAAGDRARAIALATKVHDKAHQLGDAVTQLELHSLFPASELPDDSRAAGREALVARTGMRGATLDWMNIKRPAKPQIVGEVGR